MFRTEVNIKSDIRISHKSKVMFLGSCFAKNISDKASYYGFNVSHPFGAIYNPASVLKCLMLQKCYKLVTSGRLVREKGLYCNYDFHSSYSREREEEALDVMNAEIKRGGAFLQDATHIILTFGTAYAYTLNSTGEVVANCHHTDAKAFTRRRMSIDEIAAEYGSFVKEYPDKHFIFTVSPIRYIKDGLNGSRLSKAILLLAIERICAENSNCSYFPSYEIMEDDLRDYRFYAADMVHPSDVAVEYIWSKFAETYFSDETKALCKKYEELRLLENHRPQQPGSGEDLKRLEKIQEIREQIVSSR